MKLINRGFIAVFPKKPFFEWASSFESEDLFSEDDPIEPNMYLITEDFVEDEPVIQQHFKKIFRNELSMVTEEESDWEVDLTIENFREWFGILLGSTVFDLEKSNLKAEEL